jgi:hypothetical protein
VEPPKISVLLPTLTVVPGLPRRVWTAVMALTPETSNVPPLRKTAGLDAIDPFPASASVPLLMLVAP